MPGDGELPANSFPRLKDARAMAANYRRRLCYLRQLAANSFLDINRTDEMAANFFRHIPCAGLRIGQIVQRMTDAKDFGLDPVRVLAALANDVRWQAVRMMAGGAGICASDLAARTGRDVDSAGKHLRILREAGVADWRAGEDTRFTLYFIPARFRELEGVVDFGFCQFQFPDVLPLGKD